ncbi:DNA cytosine methyltransferase [Bradyrhizobium sp. CCGUVB1N3]|uniref:DNA cytosine methyltransferase n=1 Tax=Bradyrhizobium sp. CCGUVB1N3 TaxID=2949629 RepID=UPI0020B32758|nr:DNA cytosine methyltransferase [Bradyrhizobium sp. CCGUVB1N3]MCP3471807.1 DNA cytosine methyltransferase [Bradyrhizobium sp. CCGUVB1N3]MCP3473589.1 DNA cytosine methyltransferase [Bradyrhizobium sp. CCGUVB1N3]
MPSYLEFFAGGGMVRAGLGGRWKCQFANDFDPLKVQVYSDNWGEKEILEDDIHKVEAADLGRRADLAWASFPCQDLSTAGNGLGLGQANGRDRTRSGTFWAFIDLMKKLKANGRLPRIVVLENVVGLLTINGGEEFKAVIAALDRLGMRAGAAVVDARHFVPQSRQRVFIVAVSKTAKVADALVRDEPHPIWHPDPLVKAVGKLSGQCREQWMWLNLGAPPELKKTLNKIVKNKPVGVEWHTPAETKRLLAMMSDAHKKKLAEARNSGKRMVGTLSLRMRPSRGKTVQRTEICFRGLAGCLRTPKGGGSRPRVIVVRGGNVRTRLLAPSEAASLMGLKASYRLPEVYEYAFRVIGDGVAVPVVSFLRGKLLTPLLRSIKKSGGAEASRPKQTARGADQRSRRGQLELRI